MLSPPYVLTYLVTVTCASLDLCRQKAKNKARRAWGGLPGLVL